MYAVWALFSDEDSKYLNNIICNLSKEYESQIFLPHITLYGLVDIDLDYLIEIIENCSSEILPFTISKSKIEYSEDFWKTVFIRIKKNTKLEKIQSCISSDLAKFSQYSFLPHVSLIYKKLPIQKKIELIHKLEIKSTFTIKNLAIHKYSDDISHWKIIKKIFF